MNPRTKAEGKAGSEGRTTVVRYTAHSLLLTQLTVHTSHCAIGVITIAPLLFGSKISTSYVNLLISAWCSMDCE